MNVCVCRAYKDMVTWSLEDHSAVGFLSYSHLGSQPQKEVKPCCAGMSTASATESM